MAKELLALVHEYATWDAALAAGQVTDDSDGLPDRAIVPLVEHLRTAGVVTLQSCTGHLGSDDGVLWIRDDPAVAARIGAVLADPSPFTEVKLTHHPERRWEIGWHPNDAQRAMNRLREIFVESRPR